MFPLVELGLCGGGAIIINIIITFINVFISKLFNTFKSQLPFFSKMGITMTTMRNLCKKLGSSLNCLAQIYSGVITCLLQQRDIINFYY